MRFTLDTVTKTLTIEEKGGSHEVALYSGEAFDVLSQYWLQIGWALKYSYTFSWFGVPVIQLPEDMLRTQEVIFRQRPDVIIETGVAHGGSLIFYASLCKVLGRGRVIGVDIEIRPQNRRMIEEHTLSGSVTLIEGSSTEPAVIEQVRSLVQPGETVLVILDSDHSRGHVRAELEAYAPLVTPNSYIVATDGIMKDLVGAPRSKPDWGTNNPCAAAEDFLIEHPEFVLEQPAWLFNESVGLERNVTYWPGAWLSRKGDTRTQA